jgi:hypothetical protein
MNNADTKKEAKSHLPRRGRFPTPSATYLALGYCLSWSLRPRVQHSALETELNLSGCRRWLRS